MIKEDAPKLILRVAGYLLLALSVSSFVLLFIYEAGKSKQIETLMDWLVMSIKLVVTFAPLPLLISNWQKKLINSNQLAAVGVFYCFLLWLFYVR